MFKSFCTSTLLCLFILLAGCSNSRITNIHNIHSDKIVSYFKIGNTKKIELYDLLGSPWGVYKDKNITYVVYRYNDKEKSILPPKQKQLVLVFDKNDTLLNYSFSQISNNTDRFEGIK